MIDYVEKAKILSEALPYFQQHYGKTIVVKYGGNAMQTQTLKEAVIADIVLLSLVGVRVVVVHGGGPEITQMMEKMGKKSRFVNGLRYTDEETIEAVQMILCGKVGKDLVSLIHKKGGRAIGLSGLDDRIITAIRRRGETDYGLVGDVTDVNPSSITATLDRGIIPVISTVASGADADTAYNINADTAAARIATALKAEKLILLTDVPGLLRDPKDPSTLLPVVELPMVPPLIKEGVISGGMIPKVECCVEALRRGVKRAHILDGRCEHSLLIEMFSDRGIGTMLI